jgi:hypothetical protein
MGCDCDQGKTSRSYHLFVGAVVNPPGDLPRRSHPRKSAVTAEQRIGAPWGKAPCRCLEAFHAADCGGCHRNRVEAATNLYGIFFGALPEDSAKAAGLAAMTALSLNKKFAALPEMAREKALGKLRGNIQARLENMFVSGHGAFDDMKDAVFVYILNKSKTMTIVKVSPLAKN